MGPLKGLKVVEMAGIGPGPFCAMLLADMGADVVRVDRKSPTAGFDKDYQILNRGRRSIALDLKDPDDLETVLRLIEKADALIEGFRPGVMERWLARPERKATCRAPWPPGHRGEAETSNCPPEGDLGAPFVYLCI